MTGSPCAIELSKTYLVAIHHPDDYDPSVEDEAMGHDIDVLDPLYRRTAPRVPDESGADNARHYIHGCKKIAGQL
jgi:hypothetical protein